MPRGSALIAEIDDPPCRGSVQAEKDATISEQAKRIATFDSILEESEKKLKQLQ